MIENGSWSMTFEEVSYSSVSVCDTGVCLSEKKCSILLPKVTNPALGARSSCASGRDSGERCGLLFVQGCRLCDMRGVWPGAVGASGAMEAASPAVLSERVGGRLPGVGRLGAAGHTCVCKPWHAAASARTGWRADLSE